MENEIKAGDVVYLKSDPNFKMTVQYISGDEANCFWVNQSDGNSSIRHDKIPVILLKINNDTSLSEVDLNVDKSKRV